MTTSPRPWRALTVEAIEALPAQLGVLEIGDAAGNVIKIGYAGGREPFGMRSALLAEMHDADAASFRHEFTHGYLTRYEELLMIYRRDHGALPPGNADRATTIGRLRSSATEGR